MISCTPCASRDDVGCLVRYIQPFLNHGNQYYRESKLVISTFAGQASEFGCHTFERGWAHVKRRLEEITPVSERGIGIVSSLTCRLHQICFIPSFFIDPRRYPSLSFMDGYFNVRHFSPGLSQTFT